MGAWYNMGLMLFNSRRYVEALEAFDRVIEPNPADARVWTGKGDISWQVEDSTNQYLPMIAHSGGINQSTPWSGKALAYLGMKNYSSS